MVHIFQVVTAFVLYFAMTYVVHFFVNKFPTLAAIVIPGVLAFGVLLIFTPHDSLTVRILYGAGLAGAAFLQHAYGQTLDKWNV